MKEFEQIRELYQPIQPTIAIGNEDVIYLEIPPDKQIENYIYCFWQLKTSQPLDTPFIYRVVSDGCIDIFFNHKKIENNFIMGFCRKYTEFPIGESFDFIGIRFLPSVFPLLFGVNARSLSNEFQELKQVLPDLSNWMNHAINTAQSFEKITDILNDKLIRIIQEKDFDFDIRFFSALNLIFKNRGVLETESDLMTGLSPRQLRRIFNFYIGTTPKSFCKVIRFQQILNAKPSSQSLKKNKIFYDLGFFDQAHFIKDFKIFYGVTPSKSFQ